MARLQTFADAYELWDALTVVENDDVLDPDPPRERLVPMAWRFERANALAWTLGAVPHLRFPDTAVDTGGLLVGVIPALAEARPELRPLKELLDMADIHARLATFCAAARSAGVAMPGGLDPGIVHERAEAFRWVLGAE